MIVFTICVHWYFLCYGTDNFFATASEIRHIWVQWKGVDRQYALVEFIIIMDAVNLQLINKPLEYLFFLGLTWAIIINVRGISENKRKHKNILESLPWKNHIWAWFFYTCNKRMLFVKDTHTMCHNLVYMEILCFET